MKAHIMTRLSLAAAALAMTTACAALPFDARAQVMEAAPMTTPTIQQETTLSLTGTGQVERAPDMAFISVGVNVEGKTASEAMKDQAKRMNGVFSALKEAGIADKDMQTGNISLSPRYDYSKREGAPRLIGYQASNQVNVIVRDLDELGDALDAVVSAGGNTINSVSFGVDDSSEALKAARTAAVKDATTKAELYAAAAGYRVSRIITMSEGGGYNPSPMPMMARASMDMMESAPTPIAAGEVSFSAQMNVTFELVK